MTKFSSEANRGEPVLSGKCRVIAGTLLMSLYLGFFVLPCWGLITSQSLLQESEVPGFFLHEARRRNNSFNRAPFVQYYELWVTMPRGAYLKAVENGGPFPRQSILIERASFNSGADAQKYLDQKYNPSTPVANAADRWQVGSPSGGNVGERSWYAIAVAPSPGDPQFDQQQEYRQSLNHDGLLMLILYNKTVMKVNVRGTPDKPVNRNWAEELIRRAATKLATQPLDLITQVLCKHVKPHKNERVEIRVSTNVPCSFRFEIKRQGKTVYESQVSTQSGPYLFIWDGFTNSGQRASNGAHDVAITATDGSGRTATRAVKVVVNF